MKPVRVVVVDDSLTFRAMIGTLLERDRRVEIVGMARSCDEALDLVAELSPDVVTLDVLMPDGDGMEILDAIMAQQPVPVIMLSSMMQEGEPMVDDALARGATACFNKSKVMGEATRFVALVKSAARNISLPRRTKSAPLV